MKGRVLTIAGSDASGGAGIQADLKTFAAFDVYGMSAITAVTVQNTMGVKAIHSVPADVVGAQIRACLEDIGADVIKIGMVGSQDTARAILKELTRVPDIPVVLDPVLVATSGDALAEAGVVEFIREYLIPRTALLTPNIPEANTLTNTDDATESDIASYLLGLGADAVLLKGGHTQGAVVCDVLATPEGQKLFENVRLETRHTHGTGCTLASAIAAGLARGLELERAVATAIQFVHEAIKSAPRLGRGIGPLNHSAITSWR